MTTNRIGYIDFVKGLCLICVFLGHSNITLGSVTHLWQSFYMPAFFLLSGYCYKKTNSFWNNLWRDVKGLLLVYYCWGLGILAIIVGYKLMHNVSVADFIPLAERTLLGKAQHQLVEPIWFLMALFTIRVIWNLISFSISREGIQAAVILVLAIAGFLMNAYGIRETPFRLETAFVCFPFFFLGSFTRSRSANGGQQALTWPWLLGIAIVWVAGSLLNVRLYGHNVSVWSDTYNFPLLFYINAVFGTLLFLNIGQLIEKSSSRLCRATDAFFRYFGEHSLAALVTLNIAVFLATVVINQCIPGGHPFCTLCLALCLSYGFTKVLQWKPLRWLLGKW